MKQFRGLFILSALILMLWMPQSAAAQGETAQCDYVRLHILAESDDPWDQAVKLCVRDAVRACTAQLLANCADADDAWQTLARHQNEILLTAQDCARACGFENEISLEMGVFPFPERVYGEETVPAGDYRAVRILLGAGEGRNWWCVLYPSLCLPQEAASLDEISFYSELHQFFLRLWKKVCA